MPEHVHLMILPALLEYPVDAVLKVLKGSFANSVLRRWRELDAPILKRITGRNGKLHFWQVGGGYDRNIYSEKEFLAKLDYIHNNPITRGLVNHPTEWRWSSARWYDGQRGEGILPIDAILV